jgi:hypothetical protein
VPDRAGWPKQSWEARALTAMAGDRSHTGEGQDGAGHCEVVQRR